MTEYRDPGMGHAGADGQVIAELAQRLEVRRGRVIPARLPWETDTAYANSSVEQIETNRRGV